MTLIELLVFVSAFLVGTMTFSVARFYFNVWAGFSAAFLALVVFFKTLIWYAGFRPNEIEFVGPKPFSEYDLPNRPAPRPVCPFPVQPRDTAATPPPVQFAN